MDIYNPPKYINLNLDNQLEFFEHARKLKSFVFRGQRDHTWKLSSSLEREYNSKGYSKRQALIGLENCSIDYFKKRAHHHDLGIGKDSKLQDILNTMQHYGCPTRLIDFTRSFYIATYFAVNDLHSEAEQYSIWALNHSILTLKTQEFISKHIDTGTPLIDFVYDFLSPEPPGVFTIEPDMISKRMSSQQGVLLAQINMNTTFMYNLCAMLGISEEYENVSLHDFKEINEICINSYVYIIKINFDAKYIKSIRSELLSLNITSETLFPDFTGLAKSAVEHLLWQ